MNYLSAEQVEDDVLGGPCPRPLITAFTRPARQTQDRPFFGAGTGHHGTRIVIHISLDTENVRRGAVPGIGSIIDSGSAFSRLAHTNAQAVLVNHGGSRVAAGAGPGRRRCLAAGRPPRIGPRPTIRPASDPWPATGRAGGEARPVGPFPNGPDSLYRGWVGAAASRLKLTGECVRLCFHPILPSWGLISHDDAHPCRLYCVLLLSVGVPESGQGPIEVRAGGNNGVRTVRPSNDS
jgi:hypothetical protein